MLPLKDKLEPPGTLITYLADGHPFSLGKRVCVRVRVCVFVCVCVRERERE
jgi:hypothetical protein